MLDLLILFLGIINIPIKIEVGEISYYTNSECPGTMANGSKFDDSKLTMATRNDPFGTEKIIIANNVAVRCVVTDRGPKPKHRIADVSKETMKQLGGLKSGTVKAVIITRKDNSQVSNAPNL